MKRILSYLALIGVLSACGAGNTTPPTQNGSNNNTLPTCGTFTTSNDSKGTAFNGQTSEPLSSSFTSGNLSGVGIGCNTQGVFSGKRIIRAIRIDLVTTGRITDSLSYPANVSYKETDVGTPCGTFGCPTLEWKNTPGSSDVRIESITGDTFRFVYSNLVLKPVDSAKGNLGLSADFTTKLRN